MDKNSPGAGDDGQHCKDTPATVEGAPSFLMLDDDEYECENCSGFPESHIGPDNRCPLWLAGSGDACANCGSAIAKHGTPGYLRHCPPKNSPPPRDEQPMAPLAPAPITRRLDLAAGQSPREGFEGVDIWPASQHVVDLQRYPWPFADNSVLELNCSHYIEHIPMEMVPIVEPVTGRLIGHKDALFAFFDECYRILVPDGWLHLQWPAHSSNRAFQDPTHRRFIPMETMMYLDANWRKANRLDHYNVECHFEGKCNPQISVALVHRHPEVVSNHITRYWNSMVDYEAHMQKRPRP